MTFKELRVRRGYPNGLELGRVAGIDETLISKFDRGIVPDPRYSTVKALAGALGVSTETVSRAISRSVAARSAAAA
jgi:predicted transcriptional regulator